MTFDYYLFSADYFIIDIYLNNFDISYDFCIIMLKILFKFLTINCLKFEIFFHLSYN
jgi:hypothetical protein